MSAWLCSEDHISCIVNAVGGDERDFRMLVAENVRSLEERYPGRDFLEEWKGDAKAYVFKPAARYTMTQVVKSCDSYDYQACETSDYDGTAAAKFVHKARRYAVSRGGKTKGNAYDKADWGL